MTVSFYEDVRFLCSIPQGDTVNIDENENDLQTVLSYDAVIAQQDYLCGELGLPNTITQFRKGPLDCWERIDSRVSAITLRSSCDIHRRCINNQGKLCRDCESIYAELFHNLPDGDLYSALTQKIDNMPAVWDKQICGCDLTLDKPEVRKEFRTTYIQYRCPMLGYRELMFPIMFEGKVIAVLTVGQMKIIGEESVIFERKKNFLEKFGYLYEPYLEQKRQDVLKDQAAGEEVDPNKYDIESLSRFIIERSTRQIIPEYPELYNNIPGMIIPTFKDQLTETECTEKIEIVCRWLKKLENLLNREVRHKREAWARRLLDDALSEFHANANTDQSRSAEEALWTQVQKFTDHLVNDCEHISIIVFGAKGTHNKKVKTLEAVTYSPKTVAPSALIKYQFSLNGPVSTIVQPTDSGKHPVLFTAIDERLRQNANLKTIILQPLQDTNAASIAMLVEFRDARLKTSMEEVLIPGLLNLAVLLSVRLMVRFENNAQAQLEKSLRLYKHEIVNLTDGLNRAINGFLGNPYLKTIDDEKIKAVSRDATGTLNMFRFMSENIGILVGKPILPVVKIVPIYQSMIYKWENIRRVDARDKACDIVYKKSNITVKTDPRYIELVVYNLLTNAVKYAFDYSKIYIHCRKEYTMGRHVLSFVNYSYCIPPEERDRIFEIGFRGKDAVATYPEGSGIGLWIVCTVMDLLGGTVKLENPTCVSKQYNIPLLHAYIQDPAFYDADLESQEYQEAHNAYQTLQDQKEKNEFGEEVNAISLVVADYYWKNNWQKPAKSQVLREMHKPTYQIRFEVIL